MKEKRSPEEIAFGEWLKKQIDESEEELDFFKPLSQIEMPPPETFMVGKPNRAYRRRKYIRRVAVVLVLVLGCTFATLELFAPEETTATKVEPGKTELDSKGGFVDDSSRSFVKKNSKTFTYTDENALETAKKWEPELRLAQYMTEDYGFNILNLKVYESGAWVGEFVYANDDGDRVSIIQNHFDNAMDSPSLENVVSSEILDGDRTIYYIYDDKNDNNMAVYMPSEYDEISVVSTTPLDFDELKLIIKNLK